MSAPPAEASATPPVPRRRHRPLRWVVAAGLTALDAAVVLPDLLFGLDRRSPFVQLVAVRPQLLVPQALLVVLLLVLTLLRRRSWPILAGPLAVLLAGTAMVVPRMVADPLPTGGRPFTVLSFNTYEGRADVTALAELIRAERPDVVALPEAGSRFAGKLAPLVQPLGYRVHASTGAGRRDVQEVTALVAAGLGEVDFREGDETSSFPYVEVSGGALGTLRFVAFHSVAPLPGAVPGWNHDMGLLPQWCAGPTPAIVAGDFNATLDHSALRAGMAGCGDAADQRGAGLIPTWGPTDRTRAIGPQIDHVLATGEIEASAFRVVPLPGSDHRAILATLRLP